MSSKRSPRFFIVGAGDIGTGDLPIKKAPGDFLCAADAGYLALQEAGQYPELLVGDFDSMTECDTSCEIIRLPVEKDDTDIVFCVKEGFSRGFKEFLIYGALGGARLSHTIANIQLLRMIREKGGHGELRCGSTRVFTLTAGEEVSLSPKGSLLSVFSMTEETEVSASGVYYRMDHRILSNSFPLGVSNHITESTASITVHRGEALIILEAI